MITIAKIGTAHGVKGWLKLHSFTEPADNIFNYLPWLLQQKGQYQSIALENHRPQESHFLVKFKNINDRDQAKLLTNSHICIPRQQLPPPGDDEYYWSDLTGMTVINLQGEKLGQVDYLYNAGASDIMVLKNAKMQQIPFILHETVKSVSLNANEIIVDWQDDDEQ